MDWFEQLISRTGLPGDPRQTCGRWRSASLSSQQREPIEGLQPSAVICLGKRAASIVRMAGEGLPPMIVWNLAQAATPAVLAERRRAAAEISALVRQFFIRHKEVWA